MIHLIDRSHLALDDESSEPTEKLAYYSKVYSGSHAKIPLPTATSIISTKI